jgi:hypothetical protein
MPNIVSSVKRRQTLQQLNKSTNAINDQYVEYRRLGRALPNAKTKFFLSKSEESLWNPGISKQQAKKTESVISTPNSPVSIWLNDLREMEEPECLCILQAKSLSKILLTAASSRESHVIKTSNELQNTTKHPISTWFSNRSNWTNGNGHSDEITRTIGKKI